MFLAILTLTCLAAGPVCAEEGKHGEPPIFTPVRYDLGLWTLVVFLLLFFILAKYAWGPMLEGLKRREETIRGALDDAQRARDEAHRVRAELEQQLARANDQARTMLDEARRAAERTTAEMTAEAHKNMQAEQQRLQRELQMQYEQARRDIQAQVAQLATLVAGKVIRRQISADDHRQLVDEAVAELRQASDGRRQTAVV